MIAVLVAVIRLPRHVEMLPLETTGNCMRTNSDVLRELVEKVMDVGETPYCAIRDGYWILRDNPESNGWERKYKIGLKALPDWMSAIGELGNAARQTASRLQS